MTSGFREWSLGFLAPWRGLGLLFRKPELLKWAITPFFLTVIVFIVGAWLMIPPLGRQVLGGVRSSLFLLGFEDTSWLYMPLFYLYMAFAWCIAIIALFFGLWLIARIIAAPFYSLLAERALEIVGALPETPFQMSTWLRQTPRMFGISIARAAIFALIGFSPLLLSFIPMVGAVTPFLFLLMAAFDVADFALEGLQMGLRARFQFFMAHFFAFLGLACTMGLIFVVPGLSFFLFPASIVGAADLLQRLNGWKGVPASSSL